MLKVAIVGCGLIVRKKHLPVFLKLKPKLEVVALCDLNETLARELARSFNIKKVYTDFSKMLKEVKPDIVDISTPPSTHAQLCIEAIQNNCNVVLEKPMALSIVDCDRMIETATKYKRKICVIHNQIFNPAFIKARDIISKRKLGGFLGMRVFLSTPISYMTSRSKHWTHKLPGGVLAETGPHAVYLSLALLDKIKEINVYAKKQLLEYPWSRFEDFRIDLVANNGISSIALVYSTNQWRAEVEIFASRGILKVDLKNRFLIKYNLSGLKPFFIGKFSLSLIYQTAKEFILHSLQYIFGNNLDTHYIIISKFIESILDDKALPITTQEAREVVGVMEMVVKKLEEKYGL